MFGTGPQSELCLRTQDGAADGRPVRHEAPHCLAAALRCRLVRPSVRSSIRPFIRPCLSLPPSLPHSVPRSLPPSVHPSVRPSVAYSLARLLPPSFSPPSFLPSSLTPSPSLVYQRAAPPRRRACSRSHDPRSSCPPRPVGRDRRASGTYSSQPARSVSPRSRGRLGAAAHRGYGEATLSLQVGRALHREGRPPPRGGGPGRTGRSPPPSALGGTALQPCAVGQPGRSELGARGSTRLVPWLCCCRAAWWLRAARTHQQRGLSRAGWTCHVHGVVLGTPAAPSSPSSDAAALHTRPAGAFWQLTNHL